MIASAAGLPHASAQGDYPSRPIKIIIPNSPGNPGDVVARAFAEKAAQTLGQPLVFEYRAGASTTIGTQSVARAEPDGYTILGFPSSGLTVTLLRKVSYSLENDLKPVIGLGSIPLALVVRVDSQFKTFDDLAAAVRKGEPTYGTSGPGTIAHLSTAQFLNKVNGRGVHVPFRGNPDIMVGLMGGQIDFFFASVGDASAAADKVRVLAVTATERVPDLPDVPTMSELGIANFSPKLWYALMVPSRTPDAIVARLSGAFTEAGKDPTLVKHLSAFGMVVEPLDSQVVSAMMKEEAARWRSVIELNKITLGN
jgi:tripartite-type tricarboxylate transporter receptor subunit TctC